MPNFNPHDYTANGETRTDLEFERMEMMRIAVDEIAGIRQAMERMAMRAEESTSILKEIAVSGGAIEPR